jgi:quinol-cytochrome oxidoreductase complex cytochrome b subunit
MSLLPSKRWQRVVTFFVVALGYAAVLWFYVFPWLDRTFINRPALG